MTAQTWRVVLESGEVKSAEVRARRWADGLWWHLASPYDGGACKTPRAAVAQLAAYAGFGSEVIEIRGPGELTTAEAVAAAVAAETARCIAVCDDTARGLYASDLDHREFLGDGASAAGDAGLVATTPVGETRAQQDAEFIAAARSDVPALVARVRELEAAAQTVADATRAEERERCARVLDAMAREAADEDDMLLVASACAVAIRSGREP